MENRATTDLDNCCGLGIHSKFGSTRRNLRDSHANLRTMPVWGLCSATNMATLSPYLITRKTGPCTQKPLWGLNIWRNLNNHLKENRIHVRIWQNKWLKRLKCKVSTATASSRDCTVSADIIFLNEQQKEVILSHILFFKKKTHCRKCQRKPGDWPRDSGQRIVPKQTAGFYCSSTVYLA